MVLMAGIYCISGEERRERMAINLACVMTAKDRQHTLLLLQLLQLPIPSRQQRMPALRSDISAALAGADAAWEAVRGWP